MPQRQVFDSRTGMFSFTGLTTNKCGEISRATLLTDGKILFVADDENEGVPADAELYEPVAGTFNSLGHTIKPHKFSTAALIPDATVLITGGQLPGGNGDPSTEIYTSTTGTFALTRKMNTGRHYHTATLLPDGSVWSSAATAYTLEGLPALKSIVQVC